MKIAKKSEKKRTRGGNQAYKKANGQLYIKCDHCEKHMNVKSHARHMRDKHEEKGEETLLAGEEESESVRKRVRV